MIIPILVLGLILRLVNLNQSLWLDEAITALAVKNNSFVELITKFAPGDFHPPFYYLVLKLWTNIFGYSEIALRFPSILFGVATIYFAYLIGKELFKHKAGLVAALFLAINPLAIYYSQEVRMYSLAMLAVSSAVYFFLKKSWLLFVLSLILAAYTDYLPILLVPVFFIDAKDKRPILISFLAIFILFVPWLYIFSQQLFTGLLISSSLPGWSALSSFSWKDLPLTFVKFIIGRISLDNKLLYAVVIAPVSTLYIWILSRAKNRLLWLWLIAPSILALMVSLKIPIYSYFRLLFILPAFCLLLAHGVRQNKFLIGLICLVSLICLSIFNLFPKFQREDWRSTVKYIESDGGLALIPNLAQAAPIQYYSRTLPVEDKNNFQPNGYRTIYLIRYVQNIFDPQDSERQSIEASGYNKTEEKSFPGVVVWKYQK